jgi:ubiquinone/menaquinone biosynthesis C-methylase UbiE
VAEGAGVAKLENRDKHGHRDVDRYIEILESERRVEEMRPDFVVGKLSLATDAVVADIGCGPGVFARRFATAAPEGVIFAVDVEPRQLDRLREHLLAEDLTNVVPVLASYSTPHLPEGRFDLVLISDTYHHIEQRLEYMRGVRRLLAPGGRLAIFEYKPGDLPVGPSAKHKLPEGVLEKELVEAGYELIVDHASHEYHDFQEWRATD